MEGDGLSFFGCKMHCFINGRYYANLLKQLQKVIKSKYPGVLFYQDNVPAHKSLVLMAAVHDQPPYSPDLGSYD